MLDADDRTRVCDELKKHSHPLQPTSPSLYNIINGKVAGASVNVHDALQIGEDMLLNFRLSLPGGFHAPLKKQSQNYGIDQMWHSNRRQDAV